MMRPTVQRSLLVCLSSAATGCLSFNADCPPDTTDVMGYSDAPFALSRALVRTRETPIGNLVADAFYEQARASGSVDIGLVPAGAIRDHDDCEANPALGPGAIRRGELADMLPNGYSLAVITLAEADLWRALEHGVARLGQLGELGAPTRFLLVSHVRIRIDCERAPAGEATDGNRVVGIDFINGAGTVTLLDRANPTRTFNVATNTFLLGGGDGFRWFRNGFARSTDEFEAVGNYISTRPGRAVAPQLDGRITMEHCAPPRPN